MVRPSQPIIQFFFRVPQGDIRIRSFGESAFFGIETKDPGRIGSGQFHEAVRGDATGVNGMGPENRQAVGYSRQAIGNKSEVLFAKFFSRNGNFPAFVNDWLSAIEEERAMIGRQDLDGTIQQALPEPLLVNWLAHRR